MAVRKVERLGPGRVGLMAPSGSGAAAILADLRPPLRRHSEPALVAAHRGAWEHPRSCVEPYGGPFLTCAPLPGRRRLSGVRRLRIWVGVRILRRAHPGA